MEKKLIIQLRKKSGQDMKILTKEINNLLDRGIKLSIKSGEIDDNHLTVWEFRADSEIIDNLFQQAEKIFKKHKLSDSLYSIKVSD